MDGPDLGTALERADDRILVGRASDGDVRAFGVLLRRYAGLLRRYVDRFTRNSADTDDVLQEVYTTAWLQLPSLRDPDRVRAWLMRIAARLALRLRAATPRHEQIEEDSAALPGPDEDLEHLDRAARLRAALDALPPRQAEAWLLREVGGHSYEEIATELGVPVSTVRGALAQARRRILDAMGGVR